MTHTGAFNYKAKKTAPQLLSYVASYTATAQNLKLKKVFRV